MPVEPSRRKPYPSDVSDEEWAFAAPSLVLMREDAPQRTYPLRESFNAVRYLARCGGTWRMLPNDWPPGEVVCGQLRRWLAASVFEQMTHDLRELLRLFEGREAQPTAAMLDSRPLQSTPEPGARAGFDGAKRKSGGHTGSFARPAGDTGQRAGPRPSGGVSSADSAGDG